MVSLVRAPQVAASAPALDAAQRPVLAEPARVVRVLGAPGTGKTTLAAELAVDRVRGGAVEADRVLLLTPDRLAAARLRDVVTARLATTTSQPLARTHQALGFGILRGEQALRGGPAPRLLTGPEQDAILKELLEGHASGEVPAPPWPESVLPALPTRGFRAELRDLLMRAVERGLGPVELAALGRRHGRPEWVAAAAVLAEYDEVTAFSRPGAYDPAWILSAAADLLEADPEALARVHAQVGLVVVDDAQELTSSAARLLALVVSPRCPVILLGDPDATVQGFRGADPGALGPTWADAFVRGEEPAAEHVLAADHRRGERLVAVSSRVAAHIGAVGGVRHRDPVPGGRSAGRVEAHVLRSVAQEGAYVASVLRRAHLDDGVPYRDMAVIVRGSARMVSLRRSLRSAGVPLAAAAAEVPLREEAVVRALLALLATVVRRARGIEPALAADVAHEILVSPLAGLDAVALRRLRRALRAAGAVATSAGDGDLVASALLDEELLDAAGPVAGGTRGVRSVARALRLATEAARLDEAGRWHSSVDAESLLWQLWEGLGVAGPWRAAALAGGAAGSRADHLLDAVLALFDSAAGFADRLPGAGPEAYLDEVLGQDVPADSLVRRAPDGDAVTLVTPAGAAGREWPLVVVAGVQEGVWPDLRLRGSLLGSQALVELLTGRGESLAAAARAVRYDETRLFHVAASRARERLVLTAVSDEDDSPSPFLDLADPSADERTYTEVPHAASLTGVVAEARRRLVGPDGSVAAGPAAVLAWLADEQVPGADPDEWWSRRAVSDERPLHLDDERVRVSPSKVESFAQCRLRWLLTSAGGESQDRSAAMLGTLVHAIAAEHPLGDEAQLLDELDRRLPELGLTDSLHDRVTRERARAMVRHYAEYVRAARAEGWEPVGTELSARASFGRADVTGRVDRLERRGEQLRVVDLKTGTTPPKDADIPEQPQLGAYQAVVDAGAFEERAPGVRSGGAVLVQLGTPNKKVKVQRQDALADAADPGWAAELVTQTAEGMAAASFTATVGPACRTCPVAAVCPAVVIEEDA